jgi:hypothetical protein
MGCTGTRCWPVQRPAELGGYGYISLHVQMQIEDAFSMQTCMHACFGTAPDARQRCQVVLERAWDGCLCVLSACHERRRTRCLACTGRVCSIFQTVRLRCLRDACRVRAYEAGADGARQSESVCRRCPGAVLRTDVLPNAFGPFTSMLPHALWAFHACKSAQNASRRCQ